MANLSYGNSGSSYYDLARQGRLFSAFASVTAPVIYSTAAGTGGPLLWNSTNDRNAVLIGVTCAITTVTTVAAALGITGNKGQTSAPTSTAAVTTSGNCFVGGPAPKCNVYATGTVTTAGNFFLPLAQLSTGALTIDNFEDGFIPLDGLIVVPPNAWAAVSASATASTTVAKIGLIWAEVPI